MAQCYSGCSSINTINTFEMFLIYIFAVFYVTVAEDLVEQFSAELPNPEQPPTTPNNCAHLLHAEETTTDSSVTFPTTSFTCWGRYDGYYADIEVDCTIFHYCQTWQFPTGLNETVKWDFACPQSTIFNQKILSCTPPNISFDCQESPNYYWVNYNLTSTTAAPTAEFSTPLPNVGQQLIVGDATHQSSAVLSDSTVIPATSNSAFEVPVSASKQPSSITFNGTDADAINFPR